MSAPLYSTAEVSSQIVLTSHRHLLHLLNRHFDKSRFWVAFRNRGCRRDGRGLSLVLQAIKIILDRQEKLVRCLKRKESP